MQAKTPFTLVTALVVGVIIGYILQGWLRQGTVTIADPAPVVSQAPVAPKEFTPEQLKGWCCPARGKGCQASPSDVDCLGAGGFVFAYEQSECVRICAPSAP